MAKDKAQENSLGLCVIVIVYHNGHRDERRRALDGVHRAGNIALIAPLWTLET